VRASNENFDRSKPKMTSAIFSVTKSDGDSSVNNNGKTGVSTKLPIVVGHIRLSGEHGLCLFARLVFGDWSMP
jgi:hypothetical protein